MTRPSNLFMGNTAFNKGRQTQTPNVTQGGQFGHIPQVGQYISSAPYIRQNLTAVLIEAPTGFQSLPDPQEWVAALQALVELAPKSIEGFNQQLTPEYATTQFGGSGEEQETLRDVKRARSVMTFNYFERYARPITKFFEGWLLNLGMDPATKFANVTTFDNNTLTDLLPDVTGMTVLFFEADPTFQFVDKAALITGMMMKTMPPVEGSRDINNMPDLTEFGIEWTGISQVGQGVEQMAQAILKTLNRTGTNPNQQPAFLDSIGANVAAVQDAGLRSQLDTASSTAIQQ